MTNSPHFAFPPSRLYPRGVDDVPPCHNALRRHEEALPLMLRALRLAENTKNPKGEPMPHIVAAALGDLGCALARNLFFWPPPDHPCVLQL